MKEYLYTLKNGLKVVLVDTRSFPSLTTLVLIGAGSRYETKKNSGISHFLEHMSFKGSKKYPTAIVLSSAIESLGGIFNAFTGKNKTGYWIKAPTKYFNTVVDILSDMIISPNLNTDEINKEKGVVIEEINMYEDLPQKKVADLYESLIYHNTSLGTDILGMKKTVSSFNRQTFIDYRKKKYGADNSVIVVAGGLGIKKEKDADKYLQIIEKGFLNWKGVKAKNDKKVNLRQKTFKVLVNYKKTKQVHLILGFKTFSLFDRRKYALFVLGAILGGGMSSRLFYQVRERRGLCYYINTGNDLYRDTGSIYTQAGVANDLSKVKESIKVILEEHYKIANGEIGNKEVSKAKEFLKGRFILSLEDSHNVASFFGRKKLIEKKIKTPKEIIKNITSVTKKQIVDLAKSVFIKENLNIALIGPFEEKNLQIGNLV